MRLIAAGPTEEAFTEENLRKTYGGRLTAMAHTGHAVAQWAAVAHGNATERRGGDKDRNGPRNGGGRLGLTPHE